jgi:hypothetical protein
VARCALPRQAIKIALRKKAKPSLRRIKNFWPQSSSVYQFSSILLSAPKRGQERELVLLKKGCDKRAFIK